MTELTWTEKYRPRYFGDVRGQDLAIEKLRSFLRNLSKSDKKAIALYGPPGTGKTSIAYVIANETQSELFEKNLTKFYARQQNKDH